MVRSLRRRASWWLVRLQAADITEADRVRFWAWLAADPRNAAAFEQVARALDEIGALKSDLRDYLPKEKAPPPPSPRIALVGAGLVLAAIAVFGTVCLWPKAPQHYETEIGEQRDLALADGSVVELNTDTQIAVDFSRRARRIRMDHGEALFQVAHDPDRPFEVEADGRSVRALGTQFVVRVEPDGMKVIVTQGVVDVGRIHRTRSDRAGRRRLVAWQGLDLSDRGGVVAHFTPRDMARRLAWRDGMLRFDGEPLRDVIKEVARHTGARFVVADPELENLHVIAYFRATNLDGFIAMLEQSFPNLVVLRSGNEIRISRRIDESRCIQRVPKAGAGSASCR